MIALPSSCERVSRLTSKAPYVGRAMRFVWLAPVSCVGVLRSAVSWWDGVLGYPGYMNERAEAASLGGWLAPACLGCLFGWRGWWFVSVVVAGSLVGVYV